MSSSNPRTLDSMIADVERLTQAAPTSDFLVRLPALWGRVLLASFLLGLATGNETVLTVAVWLLIPPLLIFAVMLWLVLPGMLLGGRR